MHRDTLSRCDELDRRTELDYLHSYSWMDLSTLARRRRVVFGSTLISLQSWLVLIPLLISVSILRNCFSSLIYSSNRFAWLKGFCVTAKNKVSEAHRDSGRAD